MKLVVIGPECGVPQWVWDEGELAGKDLSKALGVARQRVADLPQQAVDALAACVEPPLGAIRVAEAVLLLLHTMERPPDGEPVPWPPTGAAAWEALRSELSTSGQCAVIAGLCTDTQLRDFPDHQVLVAKLKDAAADDALQAELASRGAAGVVLSAMLGLVRAVHTVSEEYDRRNRVQYFLPRLCSSQSFFLHHGFTHAGTADVGGVRVVTERVSWRVRDRHGEVTDNMFVAVVSDGGEGEEQLRRFTRLVCDVATVAVGSVRHLAGAMSVPPALNLMVRALLMSGHSRGWPEDHVAAQGVQCVHEFHPVQQRASAGQPAAQGSAVQRTLLDKLDSALRESPADDDFGFFGFAASPRVRQPSADAPPLHCIVMVNRKLAVCRTEAGQPPPSASDLMLLCTYVEGCFITASGGSYDPGHGAAWDPDPLRDADGAPDASKAGPTELRVRGAELVLSGLGVDRRNCTSCEAALRVELERLQRQGRVAACRKLRAAFQVLQAHVQRTGQRRSVPRHLALPDVLRPTVARRARELSPAPAVAADSPLGGSGTASASASPAHRSPARRDPRRSTLGVTGPILAATAGLGMDGALGTSPGDVLLDRYPTTFTSLLSGGSRRSSVLLRSGPSSPTATPAPGSPTSRPGMRDDAHSTQATDVGAVPLPEPPATRLPCLRVLWLERGGERCPCCVFVDSLGSHDVDETPLGSPRPGSEASTASAAADQARRRREAELKLRSIRVCLVAALPNEWRELSGRERPAALQRWLEARRPSLQRARDEVRRRLEPLVDFLTTLERTHFNLVGGPFVHDCPGLMHFLFVDRTGYNRIVAPRVLPMRPLEGSECGDGFMDIGWQEQRAVEAAMLPRVSLMLNGAHELLSRGFTESLWGDAAVQYYHKVWLEADDAEVPMDTECPGLREVLVQRPWAARDHITSTMRGVERRQVRCFELYAMFLGVVPPADVHRASEALLQLLLPHRTAR